LKIKEKVIMKKILFFMSVVLVGVFIVSCAQPESPTSLTISNTIPIVEGVAADKIKAQSFPDSGGILVTWAAGNEATGYQIWRRELDADGNPVEGSAGRISGSINISPVKKIPYYWDTAIKNGTSYQYGIVLHGYKSGGGDAVPRSEIVWQAIGPENPAAVGQGYFNLKLNPTTKLDMPSGLTATVTKINTRGVSVTGIADTPDQIEVKITGLQLGYSYEFFIQALSSGSGTGNSVIDEDYPGIPDPFILPSTVAANITPEVYSYTSNNTEYWTNPFYYSPTLGRLRYRGTGTEIINPINNYVDTGSWIVDLVIPVSLSPGLYTGFPFPNDSSPATTWEDWQGRIVARIGVVDSDKNYLYTTKPDSTVTNLSGNEKVIATFGL
jgi:hypothetical protein